MFLAATLVGWIAGDFVYMTVPAQPILLQYQSYVIYT